MNVLSFVSEKGGGGKTTLASNLAAAFKREGHRCALIDLGAENHLSNGKGEAESLPDIYDVENSALTEKLSVFSARYDLVLIDTPPASEESAREAAQVADLICLPVRVGGFDADTVRATLDLIGRHPTKEGCEIRLVLTQRRANASYEATAEALSKLGVDVIETEAKMRRAYGRALGAQCTVFDLSGAEDAVEEMAAIAYDLQHLLDELPDPSCLAERINEQLLRKLYFRGVRSGRSASDVLAEALEKCM